MCGCLSHAPHWGSGLQPRHVPQLGIEPETLGFAGYKVIFENKVNNTFYLTQYIKNIIILTCNRCEIINEILHSFVYIKASKSGVYFVPTTYLDLDQPRFKCSVVAYG